MSEPADTAIDLLPPGRDIRFDAEGAPVPGRSVVVGEVGGREYPLRSHPNCKTCQSPHRHIIESSLLNGYSIPTILSHLPADAGLSVRNIESHIDREHLPMDLDVEHVAITSRAQEMSLDIRRHRGMVADHVTFARIGVQKAFKRMQEGKMPVTMENGIALASLLVKVDEIAGGGVDAQVMMRTVAEFVQTITEEVPPDILERIQARLRRNPVLGAVIDVETEDDEEPARLREGDDDASE